MRTEQISPALEFATLIVVSERGLTREQKKTGFASDVSPAVARCYCLSFDSCLLILTATTRLRAATASAAKATMD